MQLEMEKKQRFLLILSFCRLMLLLTAWFTLISYATSTTAAVRPWSFRYLVGLLISLPAIIAPLIPSKEKVTSVKLKMKTHISRGTIMLITAANVPGSQHNFGSLSQESERIHRQK